MKKRLIITILLTIFITSCGQKEEQNAIVQESENTALREEMEEETVDEGIRQLNEVLSLQPTKKERVDELTLDEFIDVASKLFVDDLGTDPYIIVSKQEWKANKNYKILSGRLRWIKFLLLYNESGQYIAGHTWSDKVYDCPKLEYFEKQMAYGIGEMCFDHGTGVGLYGNRLFKIHNDEIVNFFDYPTHGYMLLSGKDLWLEYEVNKENYESETGNIKIEYMVSICDSKQKLFETYKEIEYKWLEDEASFELSNESFFDIQNNYLIYPSVIEGLYKDNMNNLKEMLRLNVNAKEELLYFLQRESAPESEKKTLLIEALKS